jgi:hypothetical protein
MTIIALLDFEGGPVLVSDLMVSTSDPRAQNARIGSIGGRDLTVTRGYVVPYLVQKTVRIRDNAVVAFATSDENEVIRFIDYLCYESKKASADDDLVAIVNDFPPDKLANSSFIFLSCNASGQYRVALHNVKSYVRGGHKFYVSGSGDNDFVNFMELMAAHPPNLSEAKYDRAISYAFHFANFAVLGQRNFNIGLNNKWGGGCEISVIRDGVIHKMDRILFQAYDHKRSLYQSIIRPLGGMRFQFYDGEDLHIISGHPDGVYHEGILPPHKQAGRRSDEGLNCDVPNSPLWTCTILRDYSSVPQHEEKVGKKDDRIVLSAFVRYFRDGDPDCCVQMSTDSCALTYKKSGIRELIDRTTERRAG